MLYPPRMIVWKNWRPGQTKRSCAFRELSRRDARPYKSFAIPLLFIFKKKMHLTGYRDKTRYPVTVTVDFRIRLPSGSADPLQGQFRSFPTAAFHHLAALCGASGTLLLLFSMFAGSIFMFYTLLLLEKNVNIQNVKNLRSILSLDKALSLVIQ